jgi:hypothetical protein
MHADVVLGGWLVDAFTRVLQHGPRPWAGRPRSADSRRRLPRAAATPWRPCGPPFAVFVGSVWPARPPLIGYGQIGVRWSKEAVGFKLERVNPIQNWKRVFNVQALARTFFAVLKLGVLVTVLWLVVGGRLPALLAALHENAARRRRPATSPASPSTCCCGSAAVVTANRRRRLLLAALTSSRSAT